MRSSWSAERPLGWLPFLLAIIAEGALLAVVYVTVQVTIDQRRPLLGTFEFAMAAGITALAVRHRWLDPDEDPVRFLGLLGALGIAGWLWDDAARSLLVSGNPVDAISHHPGGWLLVVAGMRGVGRGREIDDRSMTRFVLLGVPALAVPWTLGQLGAAELQPVFTEEAFVGSLTFVTAGFIAAGLARLQEIGRETGVDWRRNRSWLGTVCGVLLVVLALGIPASILLGLPGDAVARGILDPLLTLLGYLFIGFATLVALTAALLARLLRSFGFQLPPPMTPDEIAALGEVPEYTIEELRGAITGIAVGWIALAVVLLVLARVWLRRRRPTSTPGMHEERSFRVPEQQIRVSLPRLRRARSATRRRPYDAVTAYLAGLEVLAAHDPASGRADHETPRAHARRIDAGAEVAALQADYSLVRYGGRALSDAEHRRALDRWRRLRRRLGG